MSDIEPNGYLLYVSRLEPENQADLVIRAYRGVAGNMPLLIVGDAPYATEYKAKLVELAAGDPRVRLTGGIYGQGYRDLQRGALALHPGDVCRGDPPGVDRGDGGGQSRPRVLDPRE